MQLLSVLNSIIEERSGCSRVLSSLLYISSLLVSLPSSSLPPASINERRTTNDERECKCDFQSTIPAEANQEETHQETLTPPTVLSLLERISIHSEPCPRPGPFPSPIPSRISKPSAQPPPGLLVPFRLAPSAPPLA